MLRRDREGERKRRIEDCEVNGSPQSVPLESQYFYTKIWFNLIKSNGPSEEGRNW